MALSREEIAARYGTALFGFAEDNKVLDDVYEEVGELKKAVEANPAIIGVMSDLVLNGEEKRRL